MYCNSCRVDHRHDCPKERGNKDCPRCGNKAKMLKDDYVCVTCREELAPKFDLSIPESRLENLKEEDISAISSVLLRFGIGFVVEPR